ncbi:MAG: multicopper oxidase domain-containing protein [Acidimicrobiales bacterium]
MAVPASRERVNAFSIFAALAGITGFALAALAVVIVSITDDDSTTAAAAPSGGGDEAAQVSAELSEFAIDVPAEIPVGATLDVTNTGNVEHDVSVRGTDLATPLIASGETATLDLSSLPAGTYELLCTVAGHESSGMVTEITISESASAPTEDVAADHGSHGAEMTPEEAAELDQIMMDSMSAFPAETEGVGNQKLEPVSVEDDGTKVFELTAEITEWEVEPGKFVDAWTYNGQVPAPWIDLEVGDTARFILTNDTPLGTDIHWHGITVPNEMDGVAPFTQELVRSGETYTYEFTVEEPMIGMYHAHAHSQVSVPNGMFGAFTVGDVELPRGQTINDVTIPEDLELALELPMVLNDAGVIGYSLNGKSFPATAPIELDQGDWMLVHYLNEGLQVHPMHLHGFRQLVVAKDGVPLESPYWMDTINVAPGERYSVLVQVTDPGVWVWHCHILTHVEREEGMFGMVTALIVN